MRPARVSDCGQSDSGDDAGGGQSREQPGGGGGDEHSSDADWCDDAWRVVEGSAEDEAEEQGERGEQDDAAAEDGEDEGDQGVSGGGGLFDREAGQEYRSLRERPAGDDPQLVIWSPEALPTGTRRVVIPPTTVPRASGVRIEDSEKAVSISRSSRAVEVPERRA